MGKIVAVYTSSEKGILKTNVGKAERITKYGIKGGNVSIDDSIEAIKND